MNRLVELVFKEWKANDIVTFKEDEARVFSKAIEHIKKDELKIVELEKEVQRMMDEMERSNPGEFQRYKMFPILRQKLAKERKVVL